MTIIIRTTTTIITTTAVVEKRSGPSSSSSSSSVSSQRRRRRRARRRVHHDWSGWLRSLFFFFFLSIDVVVVVVQAQRQACRTNEDCEGWRRGSECWVEEGYCINPFYKGGCLAQRFQQPQQLQQQDTQQLQDTQQRTTTQQYQARTTTTTATRTVMVTPIRVCHSEDPPDAAALGYCIHPDYQNKQLNRQQFNHHRRIAYPEIRLACQNWESALIQSWIFQIILSELLGVPVTLETGVPNLSLDLYHPLNALDYGSSYPWKGLQMVHQYQQQHRNSQQSSSQSQYQYPSGTCPPNQSVRRQYSQQSTTTMTKRDQDDKDDDDSQQQAEDEEQQQQAEEPIDREYIPCTHAITEVWLGHWKDITAAWDAGWIERPVPSGMLGLEGWFLPKFTGQRDPTLLSYLGLQGDKNRQKLADTFLRPTTFYEYCTQVSPTNCTNETATTTNPPYHDIVYRTASRPPQSPDEYDRFFIPNGVYMGHFRKTQENICRPSSSSSNDTDNKHTPNCTGHIADYPCGWTSAMEQKTFHLNIALQSSGKERGSRGYTYQQLTDLWMAANATRNNVLSIWFTPQTVLQQLVGTDAELQLVGLPWPTQDCFEHRVSPQERCSLNQTERVGHVRGVCATQSSSVYRIVSSTVYGQSRPSSQPEGLWSPAYDLLKTMSISELQIGEILDAWTRKTTTTTRTTTTNSNSSSSDDNHNNDDINLNDLREATCQWVLDHLDDVRAMFPKTFPRVLQTKGVGGGAGTTTNDPKRGDKDNDNSSNNNNNNNNHRHPFQTAALCASLLSMLVTLATIAATIYYRHKRAVRYAQPEFLAFLLFGLVLVSLATIFWVVEPTHAVCVTSVWLLNIGYTLELLPLIVKIAAIHRLAIASKQFKRIQLSRRKLLEVVVGLSLLVVVFMTCWTCLDPPRRVAEYTLTDRTTLNSYTLTEETIVEETFSCSNTQQGTSVVWWWMVSILWHALLLLSATVMAIQTRKLQDEVNESRILATLIYSQFVFVLFRGLVVLVVQDSSLFGNNNNGNNGSNYGSSSSARQSAWMVSLVVSCDVMATCAIYFVPKFVSKEPDKSRQAVLEAMLRTSILGPPPPTFTNAGGGGVNANANDQQHGPPCYSDLSSSSALQWDMIPYTTNTTNAAAVTITTERSGPFHHPRSSFVSSTSSSASAATTTTRRLENNNNNHKVSPPATLKEEVEEDGENGPREDGEEDADSTGLGKEKIIENDDDNSNNNNKEEEEEQSTPSNTTSTSSSIRAEEEEDDDDDDDEEEEDTKPVGANDKTKQWEEEEETFSHNGNDKEEPTEEEDHSHNPEQTKQREGVVVPQRNQKAAAAMTAGTTTTSTNHSPSAASEHEHPLLVALHNQVDNQSFHSLTRLLEERKSAAKTRRKKRTLLQQLQEQGSASMRSLQQDEIFDGNNGDNNNSGSGNGDDSTNRKNNDEGTAFGLSTRIGHERYHQSHPEGLSTPRIRSERHFHSHNEGSHNEGLWKQLASSFRISKKSVSRSTTTTTTATENNSNDNDTNFRSFFLRGLADSWRNRQDEIILLDGVVLRDGEDTVHSSSSRRLAAPAASWMREQSSSLSSPSIVLQQQSKPSPSVPSQEPQRQEQQQQKQQQGIPPSPPPSTLTGNESALYS